MLKVQEAKRKRPGAQPWDVKTPSRLECFLGWCVHGYTALGLVAGAMIAVLLVRGGPTAIRWSFFLMWGATIVDATDGTLARRVRIKDVVPSFDGRRLDDLTDFLNYAFLPLLLIWRTQLLPPGQDGWLILPLLASAYGFCQVQAKTDDGYFLGFPSLWNVVAFYLYVLPLGRWASLGVVIILAALTFVPSKHLYPSQPGRLNQLTMVLGSVWAALLGWLIWRLPTSPSTPIDPFTFNLTLVSLFFPIFYLGVSWIISLSHWQKRLQEA
jgi:phosphatidylcholine synthase